MFVSTAWAQDIDPEQGLFEEGPPPEPAVGYDDESAFDASEPEADEPGDSEEGGAVLLAGKFGGGLPFNDFDVNVAGAIEVGYLFSRSEPSIGAYLDVSYFVPQAEGSAADMRLAAASTGGDGAYTWHAWQKQLTFQPTFLYRLTMLSDMVVPYAGIGPRIYLLETVVDGKSGDESFPISEETSTRVGFGLPLGAEITLGPGGLIAELLFQWGPLPHEITGDTHLASMGLWIGYRALL